jgi:hypothetical protein
MVKLQAADMIDILVPVLGRPQNAAPLVQNIRDTTTEPARVWFLSSPGDNEQIEVCAELASASIWENLWVSQIIVGWEPGHADYSRKINAGFVATGAMDEPSEWLFMCADDVRFEPRWDTLALKSAGDRYHVIGTNDLANAQVQRGQFGTHCLIRRRYVTEQGGTADNQPGVVLHEGYDHNFVDRELCHVAQSRGVFAFARHSRVRHYHPLWRTAPNDPTYRKALAKFRDDQRLFLSRAALWGFTGLSAPERKMAA